MIYVDKKYLPDSTIHKNESITIYPNPAADFFTISMPDYCSPDYCCEESGIHWTLYDMQGRKIKSGIAPERWSNINISVQDIQSGIYLFNVFDTGRKIVSNKKIIVK